LVTANSSSNLPKSFVTLSEVIWCTMTSGAASRTAASIASRSSPSITTGTPRRGQASRLARVPGAGGDLVTTGDQGWDQVPADRAGATCHEHSHV
jgi:hypothetical protein